MGKPSFYRWCLIVIASAFFLSACSPTQEVTALNTPTSTVKMVTSTATQTPQPTQTATATPPEPTQMPSLTPTPTWTFNEPGEVIAPILLYHRIAGETFDNRYQVSIPDFRAQMETLHELGYTTIPVSRLLDALLEGSTLPEKPIVITFDDGHESVYKQAFPIMEEFGFSGVFYIVANRIYDVPDFVNVEELKEMIAAGWEIGSHSYTHADLTLNHDSAGYEIGQSKSDLKAALSTDIQTFAYPFGKIDPASAGKVIAYGYRAGMGLGTSVTHTLNTLYYLDRREVYGYFTIDDFLALLGEE